MAIQRATWWMSSEWSTPRLAEPVLLNKRAVIIFLTLSCLGPLEAVPLYVNNSGSPACSDTTTKANNSPSSPWCTIHRAAKGATPGSNPDANQAAGAGDTVNITCGLYPIYGTNTNGFGGTALQPVNQGTPGNPLRFQAVNNQFACIRLNWANANRGSAIGGQDINYTEWSGFDINETDLPWPGATNNGFQNGQVWIGGPDQGNGVTGNVIENSRFRGTVTATRDGDNYTLIRLHGVNGLTLRNLHILDVGETDENSSGSTWYFALNVLVENCLFENMGSGVYVKGERDPAPLHSRTVFRNNIFKNTHNGLDFFTAGNGEALSPILIHNNLFIRNEYTIYLLTAFGDTRAPNDIKILSNTIYEPAARCLEIRGELENEAHIEFANNICVKTGGPAIDSDGGGLTTASLERDRFSADHNLYQTDTSYLTGIPGTRTSLATWQSVWGQDAAAPASLNANPQFMNAAADDFHLGASSPARSLGRARWGIGGSNGTVIPAGAYITGSETIGLFSGTPPPPPPPPPPPSADRCDVNGNGATNVTDVQLGANQAIAVVACLPVGQAGSADINGDALCNIIDVQRIVNAALGGLCVIL